MPNISGTATSYNLPNYSGELFTADATLTPFLTMIGGLTGGGYETQSDEFATSSEYNHLAAAQPAISEQASLTAPTPTSYGRDQKTNVTQIFHESISISYKKQSSSAKLSGLNIAGQSNNVPDEADFQKLMALQKIARDVEYTCINGVYKKAVDDAEANKTRGMLELCSSGNTVAAAGAVLTKPLLNQLLKMMFNNGALFRDLVLFVGGTQKVNLSTLYGTAPADRNVGGVNINQIVTDFGNIGVVLSRFIPNDTLLFAEMSAVKPVFQPVPGKGNFFYEKLAVKGAGESGQIFGQFGLAHGAKTLHGSITGLATS